MLLSAQGSSEVFFRKVKFWDKGGRDAPPVFHVDGVNYLHVKVPDSASPSWPPYEANTNLSIAGWGRALGGHHTGECVALSHIGAAQAHSWHSKGAPPFDVNLIPMCPATQAASSAGLLRPAERGGGAQEFRAAV